MNGFHLLIQIIFALGLLHLRFDPRLDLFLNFQHGHFALHQPVDFLQTVCHAEQLQKLLLLLNLDAQMSGGQISQFAGITRFGNGRQCLLGHVFLHLGIKFKFRRDRTNQGRDRVLITLCLFQKPGLGFKIGVIADEAVDLNASAAFDQNFDRAIRKFQQLKDIGQNTNPKNPIFRRIILPRVALRRQQNLLVLRHHLLKRADRFIAPNKQWHDHMWKHNNVAQGQYRVAFG